MFIYDDRLFFCSYGFGANPLYSQQKNLKRNQEVQFKSQTDQENFDKLKTLTEELNESKKKLLFTLTHEHSSEHKKLKLIETLKELALFDEDVIF